MSRSIYTLLVPVAAVALVLAWRAEPAMADPSDVGENLGEEVQSWGAALLLGVAALVGLPALAKRELNQALVILMIVLVLGGFIYAGDTVQQVIESLWQTMAG
jgi:cobalamin synthase